MSVKLDFDLEDLEPFITAIVRRVIGEVDRDQAQANGAFIYSEPEAAALLKLEAYQLRDERRKGRIGASVGPRGKIMYTAADISGYLQNRRWRPRSDVAAENGTEEEYKQRVKVKLAKRDETIKAGRAKGTDRKKSS